MTTYDSFVTTPDERPTAIEEHALRHLRYIRSTLESAGSFTGISGRGTMGAGLVGVAAALVAPRAEIGWAATWLLAAAIAGPIGIGAMIRKSIRGGTSVFSGPGRRFLLAWVPPIAAAALLTIAVLRSGATGLLPPLWLLLYGAAITTGGAFSVRPVVFMGLSLMLLGAMALLFPAAGNLMLGLGFGAMHIAFGLEIARNHGG